MTPQEIQVMNSLTGESLNLVTNVMSVLPKIIKAVNDSGWISVDERLPELKVPVFAGEYINGKFVWWIFERYDDADGWLWSRYQGDLESDAYAGDFNITHWRPLLTEPCKKTQGGGNE